MTNDRAQGFLCSPFITDESIEAIGRCRLKERLQPYEGTYKYVGLLPKERMHIISQCQANPARYQQLKKIASEAIRNNKIFFTNNSCKTLSNALVERGWVEKLPPKHMNLKHIRKGDLTKDQIHKELERLLLSHLVEKCLPNFIWRTNESYAENLIDLQKNYVPMVNKLRISATWTTKQGLCSTLKRGHWFYIEDVAEVYSPRTYNCYDRSELEAFRNDFKITACTNLLKWILSKVSKNQPIFASTGTISINVMLFAQNRCKEYIYRKLNKDIDKPLANISSDQWNSFLKNYNRLISKTHTFTQVSSVKELSFHLDCAKQLLQEIHKYRPQLSCEGCSNIWITKPAHCSRGKGIKMASSFRTINEIINSSKTKYVVQKYIEEPLLIHGTKFDIRQYYLITSTCPLVIWMYKDCYLKFSSKEYNLKDFHESIHLTNNAVQRHYTNSKNRNPELPLCNMWSLEEYKAYLTNIGKENVWDSIIYPGMRKSIIGIVLGAQDTLVSCKNRFELYGCDFLLDKDFKPWLIEINSSPDLNPTTPVTAKICPAVINDIVKVVIDHRTDPNAPTGEFERIYRQPFARPRSPTICSRLFCVKGYGLPLSYFNKEEHEQVQSSQNSKKNGDSNVLNLDLMENLKVVNSLLEKLNENLPA